MLKYRGANALFQFVQLLNADLTSSMLTDTFVPYIVRLKLGVLPYRPDLPLDLFAHIAFFPAPDCTDCRNLPLVVPLLVTDDIERAATSAAAETARQFALALSILAPYAQGSGSLNSVQQTLKSLSGQNYGSLLTVGRDTQNTITARIGAAYQPAPDPTWLQKLRGDIVTRSLIGQNYDITTIVLVPTEIFDKSGKEGPEIYVNAYTEFRNASDGTLLASRPSSVALNRAEEVMSLIGLNRTDWYRAIWMPQSLEGKSLLLSDCFFGPLQKDTTDEFLINYIRITTTGAAHLPSVGQTVAQYCSQNLKSLGVPDDSQLVVQSNGARNLWAAMSRLVPDTALKSAIVKLPLVRELVIPDQQVTILDDGKSAMQAQVRTQSPALGTTAVATAKLNGKDKQGRSVTLRFLSKGSSFDQTTGILTFQFPSAAAYGLSVESSSTIVFSLDCNVERNMAAARSRCTQLSYRMARQAGQMSSSIQSCPKDKSATQQPDQATDQIELCADYAVATGSAGPEPNFTFTSGAKQIVEENGKGVAIVGFTKWGDEDSAIISVDGASISAADAGSLSNGRVKVAKPGSGITLQLINLVPGVPITIQAQGKTGKTALSFAVVPARTRTSSQ